MGYFVVLLLWIVWYVFVGEGEIVMVFVIFDEVMCFYLGGICLVVDKFNFEVGDGEFFVFVGFFGCGKFMLFCMFVGFEEVNVGCILIGDCDVIDVLLKDCDIVMVF